MAIAKHFVCLALLLVFFLSASLAIRQKSLSLDEHLHLAAGYSLWKTGKDALNPEHPPLVKWFAAWPLARADDLDIQKIAGFAEKNQLVFAQSLLYQSGVETDRVAFQGRLFCLIMGLLTCLTIYAFSYSLWGFWGAILSLFLAALCPNFLAHAPLIHTDMPVTLGFILTTFLAWRYFQNSSRKNLVLLSLGFGLALAVKYSAVLLIPYVWLTFFWVNQRRLLTQETLLQALLLLAIPTFLVSFTFGAFFNPSAYGEGLLSVYRNHLPNYLYFMNGQFSSKGFLLYYPFAMLLKIPLPTLILIGLSLFSLNKIERKVWLLLFMPFFLVLAAGMVTRHNLGVRHALPCFPALFVMAGGVAKLPLRRWAKILPVLLCAWLAIESARIHPDYLAYFNQLAGGPQGGLRYLDDSNIDWGMDLKRLPAELKRLGMEKINLDYFGFEDPQFRKINATPMQIYSRYFPQGDNVVSAQWLRRNPLIPLFKDYAYDWLERYKPAAIIGHSLYLYRFHIGEKNEFQKGINGLKREEWLAHGFTRLEKLVQENPKFYAAQIALAQAHLLHGNAQTARLILKNAAVLTPSNPHEPFLKVAAQLRESGHPKPAEIALKLF